MNRNRSARNRRAATYSPTSLRVGAYVSHELGRSRATGFVTMITSARATCPLFTISASTNMRTTLVRTFLNHRNCGTSALQRAADQ
jgi:hypothetical protein